ncbi:hypothetical protein FQN57_006127 [Myotisia sp. PD_48]|nr:hypothetical protein FQN57_006127 [Myotisia sp. PD_48]
MGVGAFFEPMAVVFLLIGGAWINREPDVTRSYFQDYFRRCPAEQESLLDKAEKGAFDRTTETLQSRPALRSQSPSFLLYEDDRWRTRELRFGWWSTTVSTPNTAMFRNRLLSRLLHKFPFLLECWYWALVYWTYQLGRAFTAYTLKDGTIDVARQHAHQIIRLEQRLHIFWERDIQDFFIGLPGLMVWINRLYSFVHIPGTIAFLVWLYYYSITRHRLQQHRRDEAEETNVDLPTGPELYKARRRTMAVCNLIAFVVFTLWPCMPPRLLSEKNVPGLIGSVSRGYGFVDTVHGKNGTGSVWTSNKFCNQYAAVPSLHFGYSLIVGITIMTIPLSSRRQPLALLSSNKKFPNTILTSWHRMLCVTLGLMYPLLILIAIVATANHFILDAVAGAIVCGLGWWGNSVLLNLLPVEDYFLWCLRIHKPEHLPLEMRDEMYH